MKAEARLIGNIMSGEVSCIEVPFFQRPYVWEEAQWKRLLTDLKEAFDNKHEHFLGSIVLKQVLTNTGEPNRRMLIDGQQRLTTFSILVKALLDKLDKDEDADLFDRTKGILYSAYQKKTPRIKHSLLDEKDYCLVFSNVDASEIKVPKEKDKNRILHCYKKYSEWLNKEKLEKEESEKEELEKEELFVEDYKKFLDFILNLKIWVVIDLDQQENEQVIFDSINSLGMQLTSADIIKNALFSKVKELDKEHYLEFYKKYWQDIFESKAETAHFWGKKRHANDRSLIERFLHNYAIVKGFFNPSDKKHTLNVLAAIYKAKIDSCENIAQLEESLLKDLPRYAQLWRDFYGRTPESYSFEDSVQAVEDRLHHTMSYFGIDSPAPLILRLKDLLKDKPEELKKCLHLITAILFKNKADDRRNPGKEYYKKFADFSKEISAKNTFENLKELIKKHDDSREWSYRFMFPTDENFSRIGTNVKAVKARVILFWIELYLRKKQNKEFIAGKDFDKFSIEHIFPQSYKTDDWKDKFNEEKDNPKDFIHQLGNLTLLKQGGNSQASNKSWKDKKEVYKQSTELLITHELLGISEWNAQEVQNRTKKLLGYFFEIWKYE